MVKLASARESRMYGPRSSRNRLEYINAGLYAFATVVLLSGFAAQLSGEPRSGLGLLLVALPVIALVNVHDLIAHLSGIDCRLNILKFDTQFAAVEFAAPVLQAFGTVLFFLGILFLFLQDERGYGYYYKVEQHAVNMLIAGSALWLLGSIQNSCQIYERAGGHVQILQESIQIPFLMGSLLFLVGAILNSREQTGHIHHGMKLLGLTWIWIGTFGSLLFFAGGLANLVKVFKMRQGDGLQLEKLRGGAQERLLDLREGQVPFILEESSRRRERPAEEGKIAIVPATPYKDVLLSQT